MRALAKPPTTRTSLAIAMASGSLVLTSPAALAQSPGSPPASAATGPQVPHLLSARQLQAIQAGRSPKEARALEAIHRWMQSEALLPLQHRSTSFLLPTHARPAKGIVVLLHGFSAGTWQMEVLAEKLAAAGFHAFAPRLPGHGLLDAQGQESPAELPSTTDWKRYLDFAQACFSLADDTGLPVSTLGLSVGATVGLAMAEDPGGTQGHQVARVVAMAPFMAPMKGDAGLSLIEALDGPSFGWAGRAVGSVPWGWGAETEAQTARGERPGHAIFTLGNVAGATRLGHQVQKDLALLKHSQVQLITTGADDAVPLWAQQQLAAGLPPQALAGWHHYPRTEAVPHPMIHPLEARGSQHIPALEALCVRFLSEGVPSQRPPGAAER